MTEKLLQFIWQFQHFNRSQLTTDTGEAIEIIIPGQFNTNQGPDFLDAKLKIGKTTWAGSVELHLKTSDWRRHKHAVDRNYNNVVLHVVWEHDESPNEIPVLELGGRVSKLLLDKYQSLMKTPSFIACEESISSVNGLTWRSWKERLLAERLMRKASVVQSYLSQNNTHWEQTCWWMLARNFGATINADAFEQMARSIPLNLLLKHRNQLQQLEALLFGQAGLLDPDFADAYPRLLKKEYLFLKEKYQLKQSSHPIHFLRMRPGNFPSVRMAQLAVLVHHSTHLFGKIKDTVSLKDLRKWFDSTANDYWHYHYRFDDDSVYRKKKLGNAMIDNLIINTVASLLFAYGSYYNEQSYKDKAIAWLEETAAESNNITKGFNKAGIDNLSAFDSQALIELKTQYCDRKMCLNCGVGNAILKTTQ